MSHRPQIVSKGPLFALLFLALLAYLPAPAHAADNILSLTEGPVCVVPPSLDFGYVLEGESRDRWLVIENLGTEKIMHFHTPAGQAADLDRSDMDEAEERDTSAMLIRVIDDRRYTEGERVNLVLPQDKIHVFDPETHQVAG